LAQTTLYANVLAKIGAERSQLIGEVKLRTLIDAKNLTDFAGQLRETTYEKQIAKISTLSSRNLEHAFNENLIETYIKIIKNSPKKAAAFLKLYLLRLEVENVKTLIKAANAKLSPQQRANKIYFSVERFFRHWAVFEEASKALDLIQTVNSFKGTGYALPLKMAMVSYETDGSTACFDVLLDKYFYEKAYEAYTNLPSKEKPHAYPYISLENDGFVLLALLRGKNLRYSPDWLRLAVPSKKFDLPNQNVETIVSATDFDSALKIVSKTHYARYFAKASSPEETLTNAQKSLTKALFLHAKESRFTEIFNVGAVLAFLTQKETEVHNLKLISLGLEAALKPEDILYQLMI
jgi:vacuolar-type H+-ATPase subunit C/Vma6